jgi:predicted alpha-1,6-mannanase (GH76 family)
MKVRTLRRSTGYITECSYREVSGVCTWRRLRERTAIPANAPASIFAVREKFGGNAS